MKTVILFFLLLSGILFLAGRIGYIMGLKDGRAERPANVCTVKEETDDIKCPDIEARILQEVNDLCPIYEFGMTMIHPQPTDL